MPLQHSIPSLGDDGDEVHDHYSNNNNKISHPCLLEPRNAYMQQISRLKESFLWAAAQGGRVNEVEALIDMGADINWVGSGGDTPLLVSIRNGHSNVALQLIRYGANIDGPETTLILPGDPPRHSTPLHVACANGNEGVAEALLLRGANPSTKDQVDRTPFQVGIVHGHSEMINKLQQGLGFVPLAHAGQGQQEQESREYGEDVNVDAEDSNGVPIVADAREGWENVVPYDLSAVERNNVLISSPTENQSVQGQDVIHLPLQQQSNMRSVDWLTHPHRPRRRATGMLENALDANHLPPTVGENSSKQEPTNVAHQLEIMRRLWRHEEEERCAIEGKAQAVQDQCAQLWTELMQSEDQMGILQGACESWKTRALSAEAEAEAARAALTKAKRDELSLEEYEEMPLSLSKQDLNSLDKLADRLKRRLSEVEKVRHNKLQEQIAKEGQRLCVICQDGEKTVLLLPCCHLCLCQKCRYRDELDDCCPLCRKPVLEKLDVFS